MFVGGFQKEVYMHGHMKKLFDGMDVDMKNQGDKLVITVSGDKEKVATLEKKLSAVKELCDCGDEECGCCGCC